MKKMIKVLLSSIICLSTLVGCSSSPYAKAEEQTLTIQGVPAVVKEWANKKITFKKSKSRCETNVEAYKLGNQHGLEYEVERADLLEN